MSHITITQLSTILNRIKTWALSKFAVKNAVSEKLEYGDMPVVVLASMGHILDGTTSDRPMSQGDTYFLPAEAGTTDRILYRSASGATKISDPKSNVIYCNAYTDLLYRWDSVQGKMVQVGGSISEEGGDSNKADILQIGDYSILHPGQWPKAIANTTQEQIGDSNFGSGSIVFTGEYLYLLGNMAESGDDDFEGFTYVDLGSPSADVVYFSLFDDCFYRWNSTLTRFDKVSNLITAAANSGLSISAGGEISAPGKADLNTNSGRLEYGQAPIVVLVSMGSDFDDGNNVLVNPGEPYYNPTTQKITIRGGGVDPISGETTQNEPIGNPQKGLIYFNQASGKFYRWTGSTFTAVNDQFISGISVNNTPVTPVNGNVDISVEGTVDPSDLFGSDGIHIDSTTGNWFIGETNTGVHAQGAAGTSYTDADLEIANTVNGQGDVLGVGAGVIIKQNLDSLFSWVKAIYDALGNIAFWSGGKPVDLMPASLDWSVPKKLLSITNSIPNSVLTINGEPAASTMYVDQGSQVTIIVEGATGYDVTSVTASSGTATDLGNGKFKVEITVDTDTALTLTGTTSIKTFDIDYDLTNCDAPSGTTNPTTIQYGSTETIYLEADSDYLLPASLPSGAVTGASASYTRDSQDLTKATLVLSNPTDDVSVTLAAHITPQLVLLKQRLVDVVGGYYYLQSDNIPARATIVCNASDVTDPCGWDQNTVNPSHTADSNMMSYSTIPIPAVATKVSMKTNSSYYFGLSLVDASGIAQNNVEWSAGGTTKELLFASYPNATHIVINFKIGSAGTTNFSNETLSSMGVEFSIT